MAKRSRWTIIRSLTSAAVFACSQAHARAEQSDLAFTKNPAVTSDRVVVANTTLYELNKVNGHVLSKYALQSPLVSSPISVNGTTYVATNDGQLRAIRSGVQIWKLLLPEGEKFPGYDCKMILAGDYLLVAGEQQTVCVSKSNGHKQWQVSFTGVIRVSGNKVIIEHRHGIETIDLLSGKSIWKLPTGFGELTGPMLVRDGAVYVSDGQIDGQFYKLDKNSGKILWQSKAYISNGSLVPLAGTQVAAVEQDGAIDIFDAASGKLEKYQATGKPHQVSELAFNHGVLYCAGTGLEGAFVRAYNPDSKEGLWVTYFEESGDGSSVGPDSYPVFYGNSLIFEIANAMVYSFDATTGKILWKTDTADKPNNAADVYLAGSTACVISYSSLTGLDASSGKIRWKVGLGDEVVTGTPRQQGNILYFQTSLATAYAVDLNSGAIVWSFGANEKKKPEGTVIKIQAPKPFSPAEWLAVTRRAKWSRRNLLDDFVANYGGELRHSELKRDKSLALLGPPTLSYRYPKCKSADKESTVDDYRLSNESGVFELAYDGDSLSRYVQSDETLTFKKRFGIIMPPGDGGVSMSKVQSACGCDTYADLIKVLGPPQRSEENISPSFPTPIRRSQYIWKILGDGRQILWVLTQGNFDKELSERSICGFAIVTLGEDLK